MPVTRAELRAEMEKLEAENAKLRAEIKGHDKELMRITGFASKASDEMDALVLQLQEANERERQQLRRFEKDREERWALELQNSLLRAMLENVTLAWGESWDCSATPGHGAMHKTVGMAKEYLTTSEKRVCVTVNVNGKLCEVGGTLTYEDILKLARQGEGASILCKPEDRRLAGFSVIKGQTVEVSDGMVIVCMMTGSA